MQVACLKSAGRLDMAFQDMSGQLIGDYQLVQPLGAGSFGAVYLAENIREHNKVAIKILRSPLTKHRDFEMFLNEVRAFLLLKHPHIMPLLDLGMSESGLPFLVMEYVAGGTLRHRYPKGTKLTLPQAVSLCT